MYKLNLFESSFELNPTHQDKTSYQARWRSPQVVNELHREQGARELFLLHDGPPYANGSLHLGHFVNKSLKDALLKFKRLEGFYAPFVPGFDCHGLPVELEVEKLGHDKSDPQRFVQACQAYALAQTQAQTAEFASFGVHADWQAPYMTMSPAFEADAARLFASLPQRSKRLRPVHWCAQCGSSLAEAEVEHRVKSSASVEVLFELTGGLERVGRKGACFLQVWTTTPYTLPANQAVGFNPGLRYVEVSVPTQEDPARTLVRVRQAQDPQSSPDVDLQDVRVRSPWSGETVPVLAADYVTSAGTGLVHLAPAFGVDDFRVCERHRATGVPGLEVTSWVNDQGVFESAGLPSHAQSLAAMSLKEASAHVMQTLRAQGLVLHETTVQHEYPHCWRHKTPLFFRASAQWFLELHELSGQAQAALEQVRFVPESGRERLGAMLRTRQSWCVSRQRLWGTPLVETQDDAQALTAVHAQGLSAWHAQGARQTLDVWFDSGVTHELVLRRRFGRTADLYLEGTDQHRGWFQSSLLTSVALHGCAPFREVLTHGFVVDEHGKKYAKSSGNYVPLQALFKKHSPDVLRVWALSQDYSRDLRMSEVSLKQAEQRLRRLRNTMRFCLQNLSDFQPGLYEPRPDVLQRACVGQLQAVQTDLRAYAQRYEFAPLLAALCQFCEALSAEYFTAWKDTLYCEAAASPARWQVQWVLWLLAKFLVRALTPLAPFAAEDMALSLGALVGEGRNGQTDSAVLLTWAGCEELPVAQAPMRGLQALRSNLHRRLEAHRDGRSAWEGLEGVKQLGQVRVQLPAQELPEGWPNTPAGLALLAQYLGCAEVELAQELRAPRASPVKALSCACCRRHCLPTVAQGSLCPRCEQVQAA